MKTNRIGPYELSQEIGRGGVSRVYCAYDHSKDREVAIKIMTPEAAKDEDFVKRFQQEIDIASSLNHPNILPVWDWGRDEDLLFLVMPLVKHGTLNDMLRQGQILTPYQAWRVAYQIGDALDYAHEHGMIHRDVKPHNIVVLDESTFALADFGLVKMMDESPHVTQPGSVLGSPSYMSPEQVRCRGLDQRTDVYSLGIVLYECLVGRLPYNSKTSMEMISQHVLAMPLLPTDIAPDFPPEIEAVLMRALVKDPEARYVSAGDFVRALGTALTSLSDEDKNSPLVTPDQILNSGSMENDPVTIILPPEQQKTPWQMILAILAGVAVVAAVVFMVNQPSTAQDSIQSSIEETGATIEASPDSKARLGGTMEVINSHWGVPEAGEAQPQDHAHSRNKAQDAARQPSTMLAAPPPENHMISVFPTD